MKIPPANTRIWIISSALFLALVIWVENDIGWSAVFAPWRRISLTALVLATGLAALSYGFRATRLYDHFSHRIHGYFPATLRLSVLHTTANNLLPMRAGEAALPLLMKRYFDARIADTVVALLWFRLLDLYCLGLISCYLLGWQTHPLWLGFGILLSAVLPLIYLIRPWLLRRLLVIQGRLGGIIQHILHNLPKQASLFFRALLWTLLSWLSKFAAFAIVVEQFLDAPLWQIGLGVIGAELSSVLPVHGLAGTGTYEGAMVLALKSVGINTAQALPAAVNLHIFMLGCTLVFALAVVLFIRRPVAPQTQQPHL